MKRFVSIVLATGMSAMFLTSCGKSPEVGSYSYEQIMAKFTGEPERNVTIKVLENDIAVDEGYFGDLIAAFNAEYAEYGIKAEDANMSQYTDLEKNGPLGYGPDVLYDANDTDTKIIDDFLAVLHKRIESGCGYATFLLSYYYGAILNYKNAAEVMLKISAGMGSSIAKRMLELTR